MTRRTHGRIWRLAVGGITLGSLLASSLGTNARSESSAPVPRIPSREPSAVAATGGVTKVRTLQATGQRALSFEENHGQTDRSVKFLSRGQGYTLFLTSTEAVLSLSPAHVELRMELVGGDPRAHAQGEAPLPGKTHYFVGNDRGNWQVDVPTYAKARFANVYPGIDLA